MNTAELTMANRICELFAAGQRVTLARYRAANSAVVAQALSPMVNELLAGGRVLVEEVAATLSDPEKRRRLAAGEGPSPEVVAVSAVVELDRHRLRLQQHAPERDARAMLTECAVALRALQQVLQELEPPVCQLARVPPRLPSPQSLSLGVRRHYRKLWHVYEHVGALTVGNARSALRAVGTRMAILVGSEVFSLLREDDQSTINSLQARLLAWLANDDDFASATALWDSLGELVSKLRQVNQREELVQHDREAIERCVAELEAYGEDALPTVTPALRSVLGFDDALDELILSDSSAKSLLRELRRARARLPSPR